MTWQAAERRDPAAAAIMAPGCNAANAGVQHRQAVSTRITHHEQATNKPMS